MGPQTGRLGRLLCRLGFHLDFFPTGRYRTRFFGRFFAEYRCRRCKRLFWEPAPRPRHPVNATHLVFRRRDGRALA